jgi:hypothetical protein
MVVEAATSAGLLISEIERDDGWRDMIRGSRLVFFAIILTCIYARINYKNKAYCT